MTRRIHLYSVTEHTGGRKDRDPVTSENVSWGTWGRELFVEAARERVPISASVALTHRCNLDCIHCYLQSHRNAAELDTEQWKAAF